MPERKPHRSRGGGGGRGYPEAAAQEGNRAREQATRIRGPDAGTVTEDAKRPTITLKTGAVVEARRAVAIVEHLRALLAVDPDEFQSLLALAEGRISDADPQHFESLRVDHFLEQDGRSIRPAVRDVLLNSYEVTREGPVIVPLRLQDEASRAAAEQAQEQLDQQRRDLLFGPDDPDAKGRSRK